MYLVKGYIKQGEEQKHVQILVEATGCEDALAKTAAAGLTDATSVSLSRVKEVICGTIGEDADPEYYVATVSESTEGSKAIKYQLLIVASDFDDANKRANSTLEQGYDMTLEALKKMKLYDVIV